MRRALNKPEWYGKRSALNISSESEPDMFKDNSDIDMEYIPDSQELNCDHSPQLKKRKTENQNKVQQNNFGSKVINNANHALEDIVLNDEFDEINALTSSDSHPSAEATSQHVDKSHNLQSRTNEDDVSYPDDVKVDGRMLLQLYKNSVETLARIAILEEALVNNQMSKIKNDRSNESKGKLEQFHLFMKSNDLPMTSLQQINIIEAKLEDEVFKKAAVSILFNLIIIILRSNDVKYT